MLCLIVQPHRQFITNGYSTLSQLLTFYVIERFHGGHRPPISGPLSEPCTDFSADLQDLAAHA